MRGTGRVHEVLNDNFRFIPARAGNRSSFSIYLFRVAVHPRSCGEQVPADVMPFCPCGSSPLVRGTVMTTAAGIVSVRFIPARAGNSGIGLGAGALLSVHPRSCGEQLDYSAAFSSCAGSSPLVRGTDESFMVSITDHRFIPARAGNSLSQIISFFTGAVHPRSCGEQDLDREGVSPLPGSSPLVRGTGLLLRTVIRQKRFIPARAGNSCEKPVDKGGITVHPRSCGEQNGRIFSARSIFGSSPLVRGTDNHLAHYIWDKRFIPARAGNSSGRIYFAMSVPVHPRSCGEQGNGVAVPIPDAGSSPLVRGTACKPPLLLFRSRFIPARAGNRSRLLIAFLSATVHPRSCGEQ